MGTIEPCDDIRSFFEEHLEEAMRELRVETQADTHTYLVELLSGFAVSERIPALSAPLVVLFEQALHAHGPERLQRMKDLGDVALLLNGFFPDSFERRGLTRAYVRDMGGRAYLVVGQAIRAGGQRGRGQVYDELAERFPDLSRVIDEVRERTAMATDGELIALYDRWLDTASPELARRLQRRGVVPQPRPTSKKLLH
jgi:hypothetical protein